MATPSNPNRKMIQFPVSAEEHKMLRIKAIEGDSNLIELCRSAVGLPAQLADDAPSGNGTTPA